jgi:capsular polysaccharide biosynthesis protein
VPGVRAGIVVVVLVLLVGLPAAWARQPAWQAHSSLLVLPVGSNDPNELASLYDTLSRGQVAATYAELLRDSRPALEARTGLRLSPGQAAAVTVDVEVVPDTSVLDITVTAAQPAVAVSVADRVADLGNRRIAALGSPYGSRTLSGAAGTAARQPLGRAASLALVGVLALLAGLVTQQVIRQLRLGGWPRGGASASPVPPAPDGPGEDLFADWDDGSSESSPGATRDAGAPASTARHRDS